MGVCSAGNCTNRHGTGFVVCRFPRDPVRRDQWRAVISKSRRQPIWQPTESSRVCEVHFRPEQWKHYRRALCEDAVPSIFCYCKPVNEKRQELHNDHTYACSPSLHKPLQEAADENCSHNLKKPLRSRTVNHNYECPFFNKDYSSEKAKVLENVQLRDAVREMREEVKAKEQEENNILAACELLQSMKNEKRQRNEKWDQDSVKNGLKLWFANGSSGYQTTSEVTKSPLPNIRTLQRRIEHIKFLPGLQVDIIDALGEKVKNLEDSRDRDASILFDEMAVRCRREYDLGTKSISGLATIPGKESELATKCQPYIFAGCHRKWKQIVGYNFLTNDGCGSQVASVLRELLIHAERIGLNIVCIVCDMGNRSVLSEMGFQTVKNGMIFKIRNPANLLKEIRCLPDPIHAIKSAKECLISNGYILLPDDIVKAFNLPTNRVELKHLEWLNDFQDNEDFKFAPRLQLKDTNAKHFRKMNAKSALHVFSHPVACGLKYLSVKGLVPVSVETTAWFVKLFNRFTELVTSRNPALAFSPTVPTEYEKAKSHLKLVADVFKRMQVGESGVWKPVQTHIIMVCECILDLQEYLIQERKYDFVFTGRFSQDTVENIISLVRMQRKKCSPMESKYRLRQLAISQCQQKIKGSSYGYDHVEDCLDLLLSLENTPSMNDLPPLDISKFQWNSYIPIGAYHLGQEDILYRVSGFALHSLIENNMLKCEECIESLQHKGEEPHPNSLLLKIMNYKKNAQFEVSDEVFQLFRDIDFNIMQWNSQLRGTQANLTPLVTDVIMPGVSQRSLQTCHDVKSILVNKFSFMKLKIASIRMNNTDTEKKTLFYASPSLAGGHFVENYQPEQYKKSQKRKGKKRKATVDAENSDDPDDPAPIGQFQSPPSKKTQKPRTKKKKTIVDAENSDDPDDPAPIGQFHSPPSKKTQKPRKKKRKTTVDAENSHDPDDSALLGQCHQPPSKIPAQFKKTANPRAKKRKAMVDAENSDNPCDTAPIGQCNPPPTKIPSQKKETISGSVKQPPSKKTTAKEPASKTNCTKQCEAKKTNRQKSKGLKRLVDLP